MDNNRVGLAGNIEVVDEGLQGYIIAIIIVGSVILLGLVAFGSYRCIRKCRGDNNTHNESLHQPLNPNYI